MRFVVFAPGGQRSSIRRESAAVDRELVALGHEVTTVATGFEPSERSTDLDWRDDSRVTDALLSADLAVYHIGDHLGNHVGAIKWLKAVPGVVCLHDFFVGHLYLGWMHHCGEPIGPTVEAWYGPSVAEEYEAAASAGPEFIERTAHIAPMTEWICSQAWGVVVHSKWGVDRVLASCPGPVRVVPLGFEPNEAEQRVVPEGSTIRILTLGHVNRNKRHDRVITAIASSEALRERVTYSVVGPIEPAMVLELSALARSLGVRFRIHGEVGSDALAQVLAESDIVVALRWPVLEAASGSAIEAMMSAKPTVVNRAGFYDELPDDVVVKIDPGAELEQLPGELERLVLDPKIRKELGERARSYARRTFRADAYAQSLASLAEEVLSVAPFLEVERRAIEQLRAWGPRVDGADEFVHHALTGLVRNRSSA